MVIQLFNSPTFQLLWRHLCDGIRSLLIQLGPHRIGHSGYDADPAGIARCGVHRARRSREHRAGRHHDHGHVLWGGRRLRLRRAVSPAGWDVAGLGAARRGADRHGGGSPVRADPRAGDDYIPRGSDHQRRGAQPAGRWSGALPQHPALREGHAVPRCARVHAHRHSSPAGRPGAATAGHGRITDDCRGTAAGHREPMGADAHPVRPAPARRG